MNELTFYCLTQSPPPPPPTPSNISIRKVMDVRSAQEDGDECWLLVSCLSDEEEMEREKVRHFLQQPCCPEAKEHYLLSLLSMSNCMDSQWAKRTLEQLEVICRCCFYFPVFACYHTAAASCKLITNLCYSCLGRVQQVLGVVYTQQDQRPISTHNCSLLLPEGAKGEFKHEPSCGEGSCNTKTNLLF